MPRPSSTTELQRPDLGVLAWEYSLKLSQQDFIGLKIMPLFPVVHQSAGYPVIPIESLLKVEDVKRAPRGEYNRSDWEFEERKYFCYESGFEEPLDDVESKLFHRYFDAEVIATERLTDILLRAQEKRIADIVMSPDNAVGKFTIIIPWSDKNCTPKSDLKKAKDAHFWATGIYPNTLVLSKTTLDNVLMSDEITEYLKYTQPHQIEATAAQIAMLATYLGIDKILVGKSIIDSAAKGLKAELKGIWPDDKMALLVTGNGGKNLKDPSFGRTFLWTQETSQNIISESYRDERRRCNVYRQRQYTGESVVFKGANFHLEGASA